MILVVGRDWDWAMKAGSCVVGERGYAVGLRSAKELRYTAHCSQPEQIIVDARAGGNLWNVIEQIPALLRTRSAPAVIVVLPWNGEEARDQAALLGAWDVLSADAGDLAQELRASSADALSARREGRLPSEPPAMCLH